MRTDVTDIVERYRHILRDVWNSCFWSSSRLRDWTSVEVFKGLKLPLFQALVAYPLGLETDQLFGAGFRVVPNSVHSAVFNELQIDSRRPSRLGEGTWIPLRGPFKADEVTLTLFDLFDWTPLRYIDLRYYVARIELLSGYPDAIGQHALVDVAEADVFWDPQLRGAHPSN